MVVETFPIAVMAAFRPPVAPGRFGEDLFGENMISAQKNQKGGYVLCFGYDKPLIRYVLE